MVDSTTIQLIAKCMNWAKHREQKAAAKMHLDLDLKSFLPNFAIVNRAKDSDPKMAWALCEPIRAGEIVVFDKAYVDFAHLHHLHHRGVIWVTRAKDNMCFDVVGQQLSEEEIQQSRHMYEAGIFVGQQPIVLSDCRIKLAKETSSEKYPDEFRMITAIVSTLPWELNSSIMAWISPHRKEQRSMQPMTARWWQPPTAIPWGTTS